MFIHKYINTVDSTYNPTITPNIVQKQNTDFYENDDR